MSVGAIAAALVPIAALLALGAVLRRLRGFSSPDFWSGAERLAYFVLLPMLLFTSIATVDLGGVPVGRVAVAVVVPYAARHGNPLRTQQGGRIGSRKGVRLPAWSLEAGARIIRTEAELVLKSRWVEPRRLTQSGFAFTHPELDDALAQIAEETRRGLVPVQLG